MAEDKLYNINQFCELCKDEIDLTLQSTGYALTKEEYNPESVGSKYWVWTNYKTKHCYRFIWDGKNEWFGLEESPFINDLEQVGFTDVILVDYNGHVDNLDNWNEIIKEITAEIE